ncbi:MAG: PHP domain-containing protein [Nitrospirae bacterium]|nr:PHP domain-containing protein [Nitrospirota bacterium]
MEEKYIDLHIHTRFSDGTLSPEEVVEYAVKNNLTAISITDHDSLRGVGSALALSRKYQLEVVPGVELTAEVDNKEIHILGYYLDWQDKELQDKLGMLQKVRMDRAKKMVEKLRELGVVISFPEVEKMAGEGAMGRLHLARVILQAGYVNSVDEVFRRYIGDEGPAYVKKYRFTPEGAMKLIVGVGGIPVLAHPSLLGNDELIPSLIKDGLRGIEVYCTNHDLESSHRYEELAYRYDLIPTGGSDCHGLAKREILIGKVKVPYSCLEKLKEAR